MSIQQRIGWICIRTWLLYCQRRSRFLLISRLWSSCAISMWVFFVPWVWKTCSNSRGRMTVRLMRRTRVTHKKKKSVVSHFYSLHQLTYIINNYLGANWWRWCHRVWESTCPLSVLLEKKWGHDHDNSFTYLPSDGSYSLPLTLLMLKEWAWALVSQTFSFFNSSSDTYPFSMMEPT